MVSDPEEIRLAGNYYKWVPDGRYKARCTGYSKLIPFKGTQKIFLTFELLDEPEAGTEIFMALNVPYTGIRPGCRYFKSWCIANNNLLPTRNAVMSARIFKGKIFMITTRTVKPKMGAEEMPFEFWYSIVDHIELLPDNQNDEELY